MKLVGANRAANVTALDELPGKSNYFISNDPKKWRTDVATRPPWRVRCHECSRDEDLPALTFFTSVK